MNTVTHKDNEMKIKLTLPWKHQTFVHYYVSSLWPVQGPGAGKCRVEVTLEGPYEILYDIICQKELSTNLREVSQCPEKAPTRTLIKAPYSITFTIKNLNLLRHLC